jgi:phosphatidylinositol glycan class M
MAKLIDESPSPKKFTDTDYDVFSDAAIHVSNGNSPFARHTYRYTPLAAYMCLPNVWIHPLCGKVIFCIFDVIMGATMWQLIESQNKNKDSTWLYVSFWLFNPVTIAMSTRGSNDNIIAMLVYVTLYYLLKKNYTAAAFWYGLSVHFKIYPIIYSFVFYLYIDCDKQGILKGTSSIWTNFFTKNRIKFTLISALTFFAFTGVFYLRYGYEFLYESLLYHFIRKDNRHNYSVYFYTIYQMYDRESSTLFAILAFVPQWSVMIITGFLFYYDLFFAMLIQTWVFVVFNKVVTEQYFLWYMSLIPFVCINNGII